MNRLALSAQVLECGPLRHTPAGVPVLEMQLAHASEVMEAGLPRRVELTLAAVALGDQARMLADTPLGAFLQVEGFLAPVRKSASRVVLHIQQARRAAGGFDTPTA
ncbi:primosomal replication protein N [Orrella sp. JC864]|uniref:primosomal replication protein N n=1 Tax=Orrella sp. JC864 TaxID=3120298 RepID=UPI00142BF8BA